MLIKPRVEHGELQEAFHRLRGELALHGFLVEVITLDAPLDPVLLEERADETAAVASVSFVPSGSDGVSRVDIWIGDRVTGTTLKRTIVPGSIEQGPQILALRALELLRSSLRSQQRDPVDSSVAGAHPERARAAVEHLREQPMLGPRFFAGLGLHLDWSLPDGSLALGPDLELGVLRKSFGVRLVTQFSLLGGVIEGTGASLRTRSALFLLEPLAAPLVTKWVRLGIFPSLGVGYLRVAGQAEEPFAGQSDAAWMFALGAGAEIAARVGKRVEVVCAGRAQTLLPRPVVALATDELSFFSPLISVSGSARLFF